MGFFGNNHLIIYLEVGALNAQVGLLMDLLKGTNTNYTEHSTHMAPNMIIAL